MARYIIREGTVRGQGRYWTLAVETGRGVCFWDYGDPIIYVDRELARKAAGTVGGRVVRLITKAERAVREEREATVRWLREQACGCPDCNAESGLEVELAGAIERGDHRKGE